MKNLMWFFYQIPGLVYFWLHQQQRRRLAVLSCLLFDWSGYTFVTYHLSRLFHE